MFYVSGLTSGSDYIVTDTADGVSEVYSESTLRDLVQRGVPIAGAMSRSIKVLNPNKVGQFYCGDFVMESEYDFIVHALGKPDKDIQHRVAQSTCFYGHLGAYDTKAIGASFPPTISPTRYAYIRDGKLFSALSHYYSDGRYGISPDKGLKYDYSIPQKPCMILNTEGREVIEWTPNINFLRLDHLNPPTTIAKIVNVPQGYAFCFGSFLSARGKGIYLRYFDTRIHCEEIESIYNKVKNDELHFVNLTVNDNVLAIDGMQGLIQYDMNMVWDVYKKTYDASKRVLSSRAKLLTSTEVKLYDSGTLSLVEATKDGKIVIPEGTVTVDSDAIKMSNTMLTYLELPSTLKAVKSDALNSGVFTTGSAQTCPPIVLNIKVKDLKAISTITDRFSLGYGYDAYSGAYQRRIIIDKRSSPVSAFLYAVTGYWCRKNVYHTGYAYKSWVCEWNNMYEQMLNDNLVPDLAMQYKLLTDVVRIFLKDFKIDKITITLDTYVTNWFDSLINLLNCYESSKACSMIDVIVQTGSGMIEASIANTILDIAVNNASVCDDQLLKYSFTALSKQAEEYRDAILRRAYTLFGQAIDLVKSTRGSVIDFSLSTDRYNYAYAAKEINRRVRG